MNNLATNSLLEEATECPTHSPYLVQRLSDQKPNLYGTVKFDIVSAEIRRMTKELGRPVRILDLGCSTSISRKYLEMNDLEFEYCGVDYEAQFMPDVLMDIRELFDERDRLPWQPDVIMLLDVLEHLPGKALDIRKVMHQCNSLVPEHGLVMVVIPQLYRLDRLKLSHLHYPEHQVRFSLGEWRDIIEKEIDVSAVRGVGYLSCIPYFPMISPFYKENNRHGRLFQFLRGKFFEWAPFKPIEILITRLVGRVPFLKGWCNSSLLICRKRA